MKSTFALAALAGLAAAAPAPQAGSTTPLRFGGIAIRSGSPIHLQSINANREAFYIDRPTQTSCPSEAGIDCTNTNKNETTFAYLNGKSTLDLSVIVPGGQRVYVAEANGQLHFTQAHSAATLGPAIFEGFNIVYDARFQFEGQDWVACPAQDAPEAWGVWAASRVIHGDGCYDFEWKVIQVDDDVENAWEYV